MRFKEVMILGLEGTTLKSTNDRPPETGKMTTSSPSAGAFISLIVPATSFLY
jgi:hypothetical protein